MADFVFIEGVANSKDLLAKFKEKVITPTAYPFNAAKGETEVLNTWTLVKETLVDTDISEMIIKGVVTLGGQTNDVYFKIANKALTDPLKFSTWEITMLSDATGSGELTTFGTTGAMVNFEWSDYTVTPTERDENSPVYYYMSVSNNKIAVVVQSDPVVNFDDTKVSFCYMGAVKPFEQNATGDLLDLEGNCLLTAGAVTAERAVPAVGDPEYFGAYTSMGNKSFQMLATKSTVKFQKHYPAFITQAPDPTVELESQGFQASRWTKRYHLSPVYVCHPYEGYRGSLDGIIAVTKHNILHLDELVVDVTGESYQQEVYQYFATDMPQSFMVTSPNSNMGVAMLKEHRYTV